MHVHLTADEQDLIAGTRRHLASTVEPEQLRRADLGEALVERSWWRTVAELGWAAPLVPEELGGGSVTGTPVRELGVVAHEQGLVVAPGPLVPVNAALAGLVLAAGERPEVGESLADVVAGEWVVVWAAGNGGAHFDAFAFAPTVAREGEDLLLTGSGVLVDVTVAADAVLLSATVDGVPTQVLLDTTAPGVRLEPLVGLDLSRRHARLVLDGARVRPADVVGTGASAVEQVERQFVVASALLAADTCGALQAGFDVTMEWLGDRHSFGRPLASYQALKHRVADIRTHLEMARAATVAALDALDAGEADAAELASVAQAYVGEHAPGIFSEFIQFHGGIGVTWEHDLHLHLRRVIANSSLLGAPADHQRRLAAIVLKGA